MNSMMRLKEGQVMLLNKIASRLPRKAPNKTKDKDQEQATAVGEA
jgi:hypothetical protein